MTARRSAALVAVALAAATVACTTPADDSSSGPPTSSEASSEAAPDGGAADASEPSPSTGERRATPTPPTPPPWLIKHGWDIPQPPFVQRNVAAMEERGFDGVVIQIPSSGDVLSQKPVSYERMRTELAPLARTTFTTMTHNFVIVYSGDLGSYDDDWSVAETNMANLARAAREVGLQGIVYDNENYKGVLWDWKAGEAPTTLREAEEIVMAKGRDILTAMASQWPDATLIAFIGPWVSHSSTADHFDDLFEFNDIAWANELIGPFFLGMASAVPGTGVRLVDGGEVYSLRSDQDFQHAYDWLKGGVTNGHELVPDELRAGYGQAVSVGFGVYDRPALDAPVDPAVWREKLSNALQAADHYVWAYTEAHDWWGKGWPEEPVPDEVVRATEAVQSELGR